LRGSLYCSLKDDSFVAVIIEATLLQYMNGKVSIWFDMRIGSIEKSKHLKLCPYVARVSTLRRGVKLTIPLNPAKYHLDILTRGAVKSFQLVKRHGKWHVHVKVECTVKWQSVYAVRGII
jgi:hypothetical protein